jgi:hypothetical protein
VLPSGNTGVDHREGLQVIKTDRFYNLLHSGYTIVLIIRYHTVSHSGHMSILVFSSYFWHPIIITDRHQRAFQESHMAQRPYRRMWKRPFVSLDPVRSTFTKRTWPIIIIFFYLDPRVHNRRANRVIRIVISVFVPTCLRDNNCLRWNV